MAVELATVIISAIGLFFAAVAAWGAVRTVQLTRRMQIEAGRKRIIEALISVKYAAEALEETPYHWASPGRGRDLLVADREQRFRDAQHELHRAWITGPLLRGGDDILEPLAALVGAFPRADDAVGQQFELNKPGEVREMAEQALNQMTAIEYEDWKPSLSERLMGSLWGLRHPRERRPARTRLIPPDE